MRDQATEGASAAADTGPGPGTDVGPGPDAGALDGAAGPGGIGAPGGVAGGLAAPGGMRAVPGEAGGRSSRWAVALVVGGGVSVQFGGALAVWLMPRIGPVGVVTVRLVVAALVLMAVCRPRLRGHARADWCTVVAFGIAMGAMNHLFYQAAARIPLGIAVTLEVLGPLALSVIAARRLVSGVWAALAVAGVVLLSGAGAGAFGGGPGGPAAWTRWARCARWPPVPCGPVTSSSAPAPGAVSRRPTDSRWR